MARLVELLRSRLQDDRATVVSFTIGLSAKASSALLDIGSGMFSVTVSGGEGVSSIVWSLSDPRYSTAERLVDALTRQPGYVVIPAEGFRADHPSADLSVLGLPELTKTYLPGTPGNNVNVAGVQVKHHLFSDKELEGFLEAAIMLHNPTYTMQRCPANEHPYVLIKAKSIAYRALAALAARTNNLGVKPEDYTALAQDADSEYTALRSVQQRAIPVPRVDTNTMGTGDAVQGVITRDGLRTRGTAPYGSAAPCLPPNFFPFADDDVEDTIVRIRWEVSKEHGFAYFELWRDTSPNVERSVAGQLIQPPVQAPEVGYTTVHSRAGTSKQIFSAYSATAGGFFFGTMAELFSFNGQTNQFIDGVASNNPISQNTQVLGEPLEPDTTYYYRLYAVNTNGHATPSEVRRVQTRGMRALFKRVGSNVKAPDAISLMGGPLAGGTEVLIKGTNFTAGTRVELNGKVCPIVDQTATTLTITTPGFVNQGFVGKLLDLVLISPNGLKDICKSAWVYTLE